MKIILYLLGFLLLFSACSTSSKKLVLPEVAPHALLEQTTFAALPEFDKENFNEVLQNFRKNCQSPAAQKRFASLCKKAANVTDAKSFIVENFTPYRVVNRPSDKPGLLTGYYEAQINASYTQDERYKYPIYATPKDLVMIELSSIYPELKHYRLRGRVEGNRVVPYFSRKESQKISLDAEVLCYCDSKIDKFFLEIQGSGIAKMDDNSSIYIGYANQNGHKYRAIGRYLIKIGALKKEEVSLQSIRKWLQENPKRVDEVLNYNKSLVFFAKRDKGATGALGIELTPYRSIAVDKRYIMLGNMIYLHADLAEGELNRFVFAQDTGGAIKGAVRADLFVGHGKRAVEFAGALKAPLTMWIVVPKKGTGKDE